MYAKSYRLLTNIFLAFILSFSLNSFADQSNPININIADQETLVQSLKGVGPAKAQAIITYRETYGPFQALEELTAVKGIGEKLLEQNKEHIVLE